MLQLDKDQECYDLIKWHATEGQRDDYDWGDTSLPYLNIKNADVLEDMEHIGRGHGVSHLAAIILLKLKLLLDTISIKLIRKVVSGRLPPELWKRIEVKTLRSPISCQWSGKSDQDITNLQRKL